MLTKSDHVRFSIGEDVESAIVIVKKMKRCRGAPQAIVDCPPIQVCAGDIQHRDTRVFDMGNRVTERNGVHVPARFVNANRDLKVIVEI